MNTQPTPRTDAEHDRICESWGSTACDYDKMKDFSCQIELELAAVTEQRDMLAKALRKLADCDWVITLPNRMDAVRTIANEALQSLTSNV